jgi:hypothetical protein
VIESPPTRLRGFIEPTTCLAHQCRPHAPRLEPLLEEGRSSCARLHAGATNCTFWYINARRTVLQLGAGQTFRTSPIKRPNHVLMIRPSCTG